VAAARILIVDDDVILLEVLGRTLSRQGYDVLLASHPREALAIVREQASIDVVLSDVVMRQMLGTELVREIAQISPRTAFLFMTAGPAQMADGIAVLRKPLSIQDLTSGVRAALEQSAQSQMDLPIRRISSSKTATLRPPIRYS